MLTPEQIKQMKQKADLSDLWDEIAQLPDDATRRVVQAMVDRLQGVITEILDVLEDAQEEKHDHDLSGKRYVIKFEQEYTSV